MADDGDGFCIDAVNLWYVSSNVTERYLSAADDWGYVLDEEDDEGEGDVGKAIWGGREEEDGFGWGGNAGWVDWNGWDG